MYHEYPYTTYYSDVDKICGACHACGLRLVIQGDYLRLVDGKGNVLSNVKVSYAEKATFDEDGKAIEAYIFDVSEDGTHIVFTKGDGTYKTITVPYSEKAVKDLQGKDLLNYSYALSISGDKLRITKGDGSVYELTIPYAVKASEDSEGKDITTYAATLEVDGDEVVLRDSKGRQLSRITVPYADEAAQAEEANHALAADHALEADEADHASDADTADYATLSTDATNAIESLVITGDQLVATTYGGTQVTLTIPYAVKAQKDDAGNVIKTTYVAGVAQDSQTGEISFYDATGAVITSLVPTASVATYDSYGNTIADYIKTITVTQGSDYMTVTHGTGTVDSIKIDYSTRAWKDTNNNVIKNFYVSYLECVEDVDDGHYKLVWYDGDNPRAELGRCEVWAYKAQVDVNNKPLTSYIADVQINSNDNVIFLDGEGNEIDGVSGTVITTPSGTVVVTLTSGTLPNATYDSSTQTLTLNPGAFPTVASASFTGTPSTNKVDFAQ